MASVSSPNQRDSKATGQVAENVYAVRVGDVNMFIYADGDHAVAVDVGGGSSIL